MNSELVACSYCGKFFKKGGIHHHIQRKHEGKVVKYNPHSGKQSEETKQKISASVKQYAKDNPRCHSIDTRKTISEKALASNHRRLVRSRRAYTMKSGEVIMLDSSWEELLAIRLDLLNINWIRPTTPLYWINKSGEKRRYFPDFYLIDYDIFLDPKNPLHINLR